MGLEYIYIMIAIVLTVIGQLLIKKGSSFVKTEEGIKKFIKSIINKYVILSAIFILAAPAFYILALSKIDLSIAFAFTGLNYPFVTLGSSIFFNEKIDKYNIIGIILILLGFIIFQR